MTMRFSFVLLLLSAAACAQPTVAPTDEPVGPVRGQDFDGYNITNSFETGYRFHTVDGNAGKYRSDINYGNGIRLLSSSLAIHSKDGHGGWFDELLLNTQGLGNDPYQFASLHVEKNRLYRYDMLWREDDYYNPALTLSFGSHLINTARRIQDHSLVLLPQSKLRLFAGYSRNTQDGPALSTENFFGPGGAEFPLFSDIRRTDDEYRAGGEFSAAGFKLSVTRAWEFFRDDTKDSLFTSSGLGRGTLLDYGRDQPMHGNVGHWRTFFMTEPKRKWGLNGRFAYAGARQNFIFDENALFNVLPGAPARQQTLLFGNGSRPVSAGNLTLTLVPTDRITIVNHSSFNNTRMNGNSVFDQLLANGLFQSYTFQFLGIRLLTNTTNIDVRVNNAIGLYTGYEVAARRIQSQQDVDGALFSRSNTLHSGMFGLRLHPLKPLSFNFEGEIGRANHPFYPISDKNYHALSARVQYRTRTLHLSAAARSFYNFNSVSLSTHSARTRSYFADASWNALSWFGLDASYSKMHVDTLTGINYFVTGQVIADKSLYLSNIHSGTLGARFAIGRRASLFAGYTRVQDTGGSPRISTVVPAFYDAQVFPLSYESPMARLSIQLHEKVRWNAGYQFYRYHEELQDVQNYRAHTGYTSITWTF